MKSALVTGGAGFVGSHLVSRLVGGGLRVVVVARPQSDLSRLADIAARIDVRVIATAIDLANAFRDASPDIVFHLASQTRVAAAAPVDDAIARVGGDLGYLLSVVKAASEAPSPPKALIRAASLAEYGAAPPPYRETDPLSPLTPYGASMAACTGILSALAPSLPFRVAQARLALVYGPGQSPSFLVAQMFENLAAGRPVHIRNPAARRDLIFVDDAVGGLLHLARRADAPGVVNICTGVGVSMREAAEAVLRLTGADPRLVTFGETPVQDGAPDLRGDPALAAAALDWRASTTFEEGVARMLANLEAKP